MIWQISIREGMKAAEQRMCKNIIRFFYNDKVEQRFPKATFANKKSKWCMLFRRKEIY